MNDDPPVSRADSPLWALLLPALIVALLCGMAMYTTGQDRECGAAGGRLEFTLTSRAGYHCVRDDTVIHP